LNKDNSNISTSFGHVKETETMKND